MYCSTCGNKIADDARFCSRCGAPVAGADGAGAPDTGAAPGIQSNGDLGSQVKRARRLSFSRLTPTMLGLLIAFFVCATVAVAAVLFYVTVYLPSQQQAQEQQAEQAVEPEDEGDETEAAVFDAKLAQYQEALRAGWNVSAGDADEDVAGVAGLFNNGTAANAVGDEEASWTPSYAVEDVNGDGHSELIVALVGPDDDYRPLAVYATDGTSVSTVAADFSSASPTTITLCTDGTVELSQTGQTGSEVIMDVENGEPVELTHFKWGLSQGDLTWRLYERGQLVEEGEAGGLDEVFEHMPEIDTTPYEGLDWQPLSSFKASDADDAGADDADAGEQRSFATSAFSFEIPEEWVGRVRVEVDGTNATIYAADYPSRALVKLNYVSSSAGGGTDMSGVTFRTDDLGNGMIVLAYGDNWAYVFASAELGGSSPRGGAPSEGEAEELVELQSLGAVSYAEVLASMRETGYVNPDPDILKKTAAGISAESFNIQLL